MSLVFTNKIPHYTFPNPSKPSPIKPISRQTTTLTQELADYTVKSMGRFTPSLSPGGVSVFSVYPDMIDIGSRQKETRLDDSLITISASLTTSQLVSSRVVFREETRCNEVEHANKS